MEQQILDLEKIEYGNFVCGDFLIVKDKLFSKIDRNFIFID